MIHTYCHVLSISTLKYNPLRGNGPKASASENIYQFEDNHHSTTASRTRLHGDQINLRSGMVHVANGQTSEILSRWLTRSRDPMSSRIRKGRLNKEWWDMLRNVVEKVMFLILLWRNMQLDMPLRNVSRYPLEHWVVLVPECLGQIYHRGIRMGLKRTIILRISSVKRRLNTK